MNLMYLLIILNLGYIAGKIELALVGEDIPCMIPLQNHCQRISCVCYSSITTPGHLIVSSMSHICQVLPSINQDDKPRFKG